MVEIRMYQNKVIKLRVHPGLRCQTKCQNRVIKLSVLQSAKCVGNVRGQTELYVANTYDC